MQTRAGHDGEGQARACSTTFQMASTVSRSAVVASQSDFLERDDVLFKCRKPKRLDKEPTAMEGSFTLGSRIAYRHSGGYVRARRAAVYETFVLVGWDTVTPAPQGTVALVGGSSAATFLSSAVDPAHAPSAWT